MNGITLFYTVNTDLNSSMCTDLQAWMCSASQFYGMYPDVGKTDYHSDGVGSRWELTLRLADTQPPC